MKYEAGNRFNPDTYFKTEVDSTSVTVKVTGELEGVEVSFDSGDVPEITSLSVTENGTYEAPEGTAYDPVTVEVPNTYTEADEGKVVSSGALVSQTSRTVTSNDTYDTTTNNEVVVAVPGPSGSISITQNGTVDVTNYAEAVVNVSGGGDTDFIQFIEGATTDLVIPATTTAVKSRLCDNDAVVETVKIPDSVTTIGESAFRNCSSLTDVEIGTGITSLDNYAIWRGTGNAINITIHATTPPTITSSSFSTSIKPNFYVPAESVNAYKTAANWTSFASNINAIPTP